MSTEQIISSNFYKPFEILVDYLNPIQSSNNNKFVGTCGSNKKFLKNALDAINILDNREDIWIKTETNNIFTFKKQDVNYVLEFDSKLFVGFRKFYDSYERKRYYCGNFMFESKNINNKMCIDMDQIKNFLQYSRGYNFVGHHSSRGNFEVVNEKYADIPNLQKLIFGNHIRKPLVTELCKCFPYENQNMLVSHAPEVNVLSDIISFLDENTIEYKLQHSSCGYKIDMYLPEYKIAVEVDEMGHSDRNAEYEQTRENTLKTQLKCKFLRINPHKNNFRISGEIGKLTRMIYC